MKATFLRAKAMDVSKSFRLIYTWVLASSDSIRSYLDLHIDGMIVNLTTVPTVLAMLQEPKYDAQYLLAINGYNPWGAPPVPQYGITIITQNIKWAGTDAPVEFTLKGTQGSPLTTVVDGSFGSVLEAGHTDYAGFTGTNIGEIVSMQFRIVADVGASGWLPGLVCLESNVLAQPVYFNFGPDEWVYFGKPITKMADALPSM